MKITVLTEREIRQCVTLDDEAIRVVEDGFTRLADGKVTMPPILSLILPGEKGEVDVKTAYVEGLDYFAVKMASGFFGNAKLGLPTGSGLMVVISAQTGFPQAVLLDNGYLTSVRTGAAGAVAAKYLARKNIETAAVVGSGSQARYQMFGLKRVRDFKRLYIYGIVPEEVQRYVKEMAPALGVEVIVAPDEGTAVRNADVVVTTTPSHQPHLRPEWVHPGLHITAMGADSPEKAEVYADVLRRADRLFCDRKSQCIRLGELRHAIEEGAIAEDVDVTELGDVTSGRKPGRTSDSQITLCDLTGTGVQDTVIAMLAFRKAKDKGLGQTIDA